MADVHYKLTYFNIQGLGEVTRMMFHVAGRKFQDVRVDRATEWPALKPHTPFGYVPVLEIDGKQLAQSPAIERYVAKELGLCGTTPMEEARVDAYCCSVRDMSLPFVYIPEEIDDTSKERYLKNAVKKALLFLATFEKRLKDHAYLVGIKVTVADIALMFWLDSFWLKTYLPTSDALTKYPGVRAHSARMKELPGMKEWLKTRPHTDC